MIPFSHRCWPPRLPPLLFPRLRLRGLRLPAEPAPTGAGHGRKVKEPPHRQHSVRARRVYGAFRGSISRAGEAKVNPANKGGNVMKVVLTPTMCLPPQWARTELLDLGLSEIRK